MTLRSRCILSERSECDGLRISIMSRHTLEDGLTNDERIRPDLYDLHIPELGPPPQLIGAWCRGELGPTDSQIIFDNKYRPQYLEYLSGNSELITSLAKLAIHNTVTVLCIEPEEKNTDLLLCHRKLLVNYCKDIEPNLDIDIR